MSWTRKRCGSLHRRKQARDFFGERRELLGRRALGRQTGGADFEDAPRLVHLFAREPVQRREKAERLAAERRRAFGDVGARSVARLDDAHRRERAQAGAHGRTAHADLEREVALGRQTIAGPERSALDEPAHVRDDLFGAAFRHASALSGSRCAAYLLDICTVTGVRSRADQSSRYLSHAAMVVISPALIPRRAGPVDRRRAARHARHDEVVAVHARHVDEVARIDDDRRSRGCRPRP